MVDCRFVNVNSSTHTVMFICMGTPSLPAAVKLQALEESYARKAEEENRRHQQSLEQQMIASGHESEARLRRQLEVEMAQFREREVSRMRLEERERYQEEQGRLRTELEGSHRQKLEAVRKMEVDTLERLRRKEQVCSNTHTSPTTLY